MRQPRILELRPTQFVLGMKEIESKTHKMKKFDKKELRAYCNDHRIPIVIGPKKELFMIDHHHFARACWERDVEDYTVKVIQDLSKESEKSFWNIMIKEGWVYLRDQFGLGPHLPQSLPTDVRCMADDPYRSLAWALIEEGSIKKKLIPFYEFQWAAYFRINFDIPLRSKSNFKSAIKLARKLVRSADAKHLPGYIALS